MHITFDSVWLAKNACTHFCLRSVMRVRRIRCSFNENIMIFRFVYVFVPFQQHYMHKHCHHIHTDSGTWIIQTRTNKLSVVVTLRRLKRHIRCLVPSQTHNIDSMFFFFFGELETFTVADTNGAFFEIQSIYFFLCVCFCVGK